MLPMLPGINLVARAPPIDKSNKTNKMATCRDFDRKYSRNRSIMDI